MGRKTASRLRQRSTYAGRPSGIYLCTGGQKLDVAETAWKPEDLRNVASRNRKEMRRGDRAAGAGHRQRKTRTALLSMDLDSDYGKSDVHDAAGRDPRLPVFQRGRRRKRPGGELHPERSRMQRSRSSGQKPDHGTRDADAPVPVRHGSRDAEGKGASGRPDGHPHGRERRASHRGRLIKILAWVRK